MEQQITPIQAIKVLFQKKYAANILLTIILLMAIGGTILLGKFFWDASVQTTRNTQDIITIVGYINKNIPPKQ